MIGQPQLAAISLIDIVTAPRTVFTAFRLLIVFACMVILYVRYLAMSLVLLNTSLSKLPNIMRKFAAPSFNFSVCNCFKETLQNPANRGLLRNVDRL